MRYYSRNEKRNSNREQDSRLPQITICSGKILYFFFLFHNTIFYKVSYFWKCLCAYRRINFCLYSGAVCHIICGASSLVWRALRWQRVASFVPLQWAAALSHAYVHVGASRACRPPKCFAVINWYKAWSQRHWEAREARLSDVQLCSGNSWGLVLPWSNKRDAGLTRLCRT